MASDLSVYTGNLLVKWLGGTDMPAAPVALYLAIFNGNPKSGGTEVTTDINSAGRQEIAWTAPGGTNALISSADVDFGDSETDGVDASHVAAFDAQTGGNLIASKAIPGGAITIAVGSGVKFLATDVSLTAGSAT